MNLRDCTTFVIDHSKETFSYVFPQTTIVMPIMRPEMIARVADLMKYAGAEIKVIREEDEEKKMRNDTKMSFKTHSAEEMLVAIHEGRDDEVNGNSLKKLDNAGLIVWHYDDHDTSTDGYRLTVEGKTALGLTLNADDVKTLAQRMTDEGLKAAVINEATADYEDLGLPADLRGKSPVEEAMEASIKGVPMTNGKYSAPIFPCITIPIPSESERNMRRAAYASIRDGLHRALSAGQALVPILDSLEETDPLLSRSGD